MASLSNDLKTKLERNPNALVSLIVRLYDDPPSRAADLQARGFTIKYTYSLTRSVAIEGTGFATFDLANEPWVASIEEDKPVHTM